VKKAEAKQGMEHRHIMSCHVIERVPDGSFSSALEPHAMPRETATGAAGVGHLGWPAQARWHKHWSAEARCNGHAEQPGGMSYQVALL
jgi:hypothetical protein